MKKQFLILTQYTYDCDTDGDYEVLDAVSLTEPDAAYSVRELILRLAQGASLPSNPVYYDQEDSFDENGNPVSDNGFFNNPTDDPDFDMCDAYNLQQSLKNSDSKGHGQSEVELRKERSAAKATDQGTRNDVPTSDSASGE